MKRVRLSLNGKGKAKTLWLGSFLVCVKREYPRSERWYLYVIKEDFRDERLKLRIR